MLTLDFGLKEQNQEESLLQTEKCQNNLISGVKKIFFFTLCKGFSSSIHSLQAEIILGAGRLSDVAQLFW